MVLSVSLRSMSVLAKHGLSSLPTMLRLIVVPAWSIRWVAVGVLLLLGSYLFTSSQSPGFGEDDYQTCVKNGIISQDGTDMNLPLDESGRFTDEVGL